MLMGSVAAVPVDAQEVEGISSLRGKSPNLPNLNGIVANRTNLRILGKALFWDISVGSDGVACATCHFHGGADIRTVNQFNPGGTAGDGSLQFDTVSDAPDHDVNQQATPDQFPFFIPDPNDPRDPDGVIRDGDDRFSSAGTYSGSFITDGTGTTFAECEISLGNLHANFQQNGRATRKVEPRQTPPVINAVFNFRQFWDGRANNVFNGLDPFGQRTNNAGQGGVLELSGGGISLQDLAIRNASLASQAVGPVLSGFEMSCGDRQFAQVGRKILSQEALQFQKVHPTDSVFRASGLVDSDGLGLTADYEDLIKSAFDPKYWDDTGYYVVDRGADTVTPVGGPADGFKVIEHNFSLFWGLALHEYQASLISDASDFDRNRLSASARRGKSVFENEGKCVACHKGPLLSGAAITSDQNNVLIEGMQLASQTNNPFNALYDDSFYNIAVTPTIEDIGLGGTDPFGNPLSFTRQWKQNTPNAIVDQINLGNNGQNVDPTQFEVQLPRSPNTRDAVDGSFKTPILRNVGTTPPYMHDGSMATLEQVIEFYDRGGNRLSLSNDSDTTGGGPGGFPRNLDADIGVLDLTEQQKDDLEAFMLTLTDSRVLCHRAPFDHPELPLSLGHDSSTDNSEIPNAASDNVQVLPAVGSRGYSRSDCFPNTGDLFGQLQTKFNGLLEPQAAAIPVTTP
jgi:cytochrome c peroxidase